MYFLKNLKSFLLWRTWVQTLPFCLKLQNYPNSISVMMCIVGVKNAKNHTKWPFESVLSCCNKIFFPPLCSFPQFSDISGQGDSVHQIIYLWFWMVFFTLFVLSKNHTYHISFSWL
jgi:hypothetical protein